MKKVLKLALGCAVAGLVLTQTANAQTQGFYTGIEGGLNWMTNFNANTNVMAAPVVGVTPQTGWAVGGVFGYDFVGPRVEFETVYRYNPTNVSVPNTALGNQVGQLAFMVNALYDFMPDSIITPYAGVGAGLALVDGNSPLSSTALAYQGIVGVGYKATENLRVNLDGRYYGTTNPSVNNAQWTNNNIGVMLSLTYKFDAPAPAPTPVAAAPAVTSFMVFFDWDKSNITAAGMNVIKQAANAYRVKGSAQITATGHTDTSGPDNYNMALSLRRATSVKNALVLEGVPASAITVVGKGEQGLLVPTGQNVREPQNRRVEIVLQ
jgi:OmpA-OmpF porin, OOP family